ncbi:PD-(D/E)XK motif protein [Pseudoxanthomonas winnipegensis]|uniref:PD-(D/E)XK motif protein n=1 Tax=Pseudoxanthomonas winnipegensis TaxID=2480810 RepID=UPI00102E05F8|nr:PD-(D/E)XK motif protein [Pseudoxanthomonas winnipegensis]RZZ89660.1 PD-(D/E)XK motif protein [Pseudoxanthomonas winnipegensis]
MSSVDPYGLPPFEEIEAALTSDAPRRIGLDTSRRFSLITEPEHGALWLLCPAGTQSLSTPLPTSVIDTSTRQIGDELHHQIGSRFSPLLREVYYFLGGVVHRAERSEEPLPDVVASELAAWEALLRIPSSMDRNQVIGLLGELWVLWRVLRNLGTGAIDCWTGPASEQHDFRLTMDDLEIKTTLSHSRDHAISGLDQLITTGQRSLSVVSIQLKPAGGGPGISLPDAISKVSQHLSSDPVSLKKFNDRLAAVGYRHDDDSRYSERYCLRSDPTLVPVDNEFPRLTVESLCAVLTSSSLRRIRKVIYTANLDGMGLALDSRDTPDALRPVDIGDLYA